MKTTKRKKKKRNPIPTDTEMARFLSHQIHFELYNLTKIIGEETIRRFKKKQPPMWKLKRDTFLDECSWVAACIENLSSMIRLYPDYCLKVAKETEEKRKMYEDINK